MSRHVCFEFRVFLFFYQKKQAHFHDLILRSWILKREIYLMYFKVYSRNNLISAKPACTSIYYDLLKFHKTNILLRNRVSAYDSPTNKFSNYVTHFILLVETITSYIRETSNSYNSFHLLKLSLRISTW